MGADAEVGVFGAVAPVVGVATSTFSGVVDAVSLVLGVPGVKKKYIAPTTSNIAPAPSRVSLFIFI